jgi:glycosyltransferase involved in cell wall biosynthesis
VEIGKLFNSWSRTVFEKMLEKKGDNERREVFVSVVIPVFNEEQTIGDIITRTKITLKKMGVSYEVLVVDDGSVDRSADISEAKKAYVLRKKHRGKGYALRSGFSYARGELIVTIDSDGSHQPEEIPLVMHDIREGKADFVIGTRFINSDVSATKMPKVNRLGNRIFNDLIWYLTGKMFSDSQSGFRAIRSSVMKRMRLSSLGYEVESEMLVKALKMGARITETPITFNQRTVGTSRLDPLKDGARILYAIMQAYLSIN